MANKYSSIWKALKANSNCTIAAPVLLQRRIIKAVIRCKTEDYAFKLKNNEARTWVKLRYIRESGRVRFFLVTYDNLANIQTGEL